MSQDNQSSFIHDLLKNDHAFPFNFGFGSIMMQEQHKLIPEETTPKKGRPKGLKNNALKTKNRRGKQKNESQKKGHWQTTENKRYHWFLELYNKHFINKHMRRMDKIFKTMALFVGTRQAEQCRSHHQKMEKKFNTFFRILQHLRMTFYHSNSTQALTKDLQDNGIEIFDELINGQLIERNLYSSQQKINEELNKSEEEQQQQLDNNQAQMPLQDSFKPELLLDEDYSKHMLCNLP